jgi:hypothetical protein
MLISDINGRGFVLSRFLVGEVLCWNDIRNQFAVVLLSVGDGFRFHLLEGILYMQSPITDWTYEVDGFLDIKD